jgi:cell division protein FtsI/penicillin-binding protein 2
VNEAMTLPTAIAQSCDTYFYQVGYRFYGMPSERGPRLQAWASRFGFGQKTGVDLGSEVAAAADARLAARRRSRSRRSGSLCRSTASGSRATRSSSRSASKDLLVTPAADGAPSTR